MRVYPCLKMAEGRGVLWHRAAARASLPPALPRESGDAGFDHEPHEPHEHAESAAVSACLFVSFVRFVRVVVNSWDGEARRSARRQGLGPAFAGKSGWVAPKPPSPSPGSRPARTGSRS